MALNIQQEAAVRAQGNTVVSAGAGAGKTTVLARRYAHLVMHEHLAVDQILTLTFTNKAANEMYERIYTTLTEYNDNPWAKKAIESFYKANIETIDSFCAKVARSGAAFFGIAPDFASGDSELAGMIANSALGFVLDNRENTALQTIMADRKIQAVAKQIFADTLLAHSPITRPLSFAAMLNTQFRIITEDYARITGEFEQQMLLQKKKMLPPPAPRIEEVIDGAAGAIKALVAYIEWVRGIRGQKETAANLARIANIALHKTVIEETYALMEIFQAQSNRNKRMARFLSFSDTARLAVDTLSCFPEIRRSYKTQIKAIMVDEFQDNNLLQKELLFLLAEDERRMEAGLPGNNDLSTGKLFFVGDEKQSIYRFRGADVSIFRALHEELPRDENADSSQDSTIHLETNYRSRPELIEAFNVLFQEVFACNGRPTEKYDAAFYPLNPGRGGAAGGGRFTHIALLIAEQMHADKIAALSAHDLEAAYIAGKIRQICAADSGWTVLKKNKDGADAETPCGYGDIAILLRKKSHQHEIERQLTQFGIPYNAEEPVSLFNDGRVSDMIAYLRLLVYPRDRLSYAAVLRSPFVRLSDSALAVCLLAFQKIPFDETCAVQIAPDDRAKYNEAGRYYRELYAASSEGRCGIEELISKLWFDLGCRFETLLPGAKKNQAEVYDYFFELGCRAEAEGKTLAQFLATVEAMQKRGFEAAAQKIERLDLPIERGPGVRILTIHKSKGLEFPVVFVYGCGDTEKSRANRGCYCFVESEEGALLTLNLPHAPELTGEKPDNYFFVKYQEEEKKKADAELRRLFYVAATRAESHLFLTGAFPKLTRDEEESEAYTEDSPLLRRIKLFRDKIEQKAGAASFLKFMTPVLAGDKNKVHGDIEEIPALTRQELRALAAEGEAAHRNVRTGSISAETRQMIQTAKEHYEQSPVDNAGPPALLYKTASGIKDEISRRKNAPETETSGAGSSAALRAANFGALVHAVIEDRFNGIAQNANPKGLLKRAVVYADRFFKSPLGAKSLAAPFRKTEYPFITLSSENETAVYVSGSIDLLFIDEDGISIVDYKSDRDPDESRHHAQLRTYREAAQNLFPQEKEIHTYLFFLREGYAVEIACDAPLA